MTLLITLLLCLSAKAGASTLTVTLSGSQSEPFCHDWGELRLGLVRVLEGELGWLSCPLFSHPAVYNYSSALSDGLNLFWYRVPVGQDLEEPIEYSDRLSKERERLWLQPAVTEDTGQYICLLRNKTSCTKIAMQLEVLQHGGGARLGQGCELPVAMAPISLEVQFQEGKSMDCPDVQDIPKANTSLSVTWYHQCKVSPFKNPNLEVKGVSLVIHVMDVFLQGAYFCLVSYERNGRLLNFTRMINVSAVYPSNLHKGPTILNPSKDEVITVKQGMEVRLECTALFPHLEGPREIWWTVDGSTVEQLGNPRFSKTSRLVTYDYGNRKEESVLIIQDFQAADLHKEYNCSVRNLRGFVTRKAQLDEEVSIPAVELGCGLVVTLFLMLLMFVIYHVFWLELLLLYRSWFGTDERHTDNKEYDVYISYARNSEEEQFVLSTLRKVLENDLGYTVCIFDRDSLPGGTITDETLSFVGRSRRLLVVLSPGYGSQGTQTLLELKAGLDGMARGGHLRVILVQYRPMQPGQGWVKELRRARVALALVRWQGDQSSELSSRFWKRLRLELPLKRVEEKSWQSEDMAMRNIIYSRALLPQQYSKETI